MTSVINERTRNLLKKLSNEADLWDGFDEKECLVENWPTGPNSSINVGDLREAREIFKEIGNGD